jgi:hypothetical protein
MAKCKTRPVWPTSACQLCHNFTITPLADHLLGTISSTMIMPGARTHPTVPPPCIVDEGRVLQKPRGSEHQKIKFRMEKNMFRKMSCVGTNWGGGALVVIRQCQEEETNGMTQSENCSVNTYECNNFIKAFLEIKETVMDPNFPRKCLINKCTWHWWYETMRHHIRCQL